MDKSKGGAPRGRGRTLLGAVTVLAAVVPLAVTGPARADAPAGGGTQWTTQQVAPGVEVRTGTLHDTAAAPSWTVTVQDPSTGGFPVRPSTPRSAPAVGGRDRGEAAHRGIPPRVEDVAWPDYADTPHGAMGLRVRVGTYATQADAQAAANSVVAAGFHAAVAWTGYDAQQTADVENIHIAVIDPHLFTGTVEGTHDGNVAQRETTSSVAAKLRSLVAATRGSS